MFYHAHILARKNICSVCVLLGGNHVVGALFFMDEIFPTTGLCASSVVSAASGEIRRKDASAGICDAHRSVNERFKLQIIGDFLPQCLYVFKRQLACQHDALHAVIVPEATAEGIDGRRLS